MTHKDRTHFHIKWVKSTHPSNVVLHNSALIARSSNRPRPPPFFRGPNPVPAIVTTQLVQSRVRNLDPSAQPSLSIVANPANCKSNLRGHPQPPCACASSLRLLLTGHASAEQPRGALGAAQFRPARRPPRDQVAHVGGRSGRSVEGVDVGGRVRRGGPSRGPDNRRCVVFPLWWRGGLCGVVCLRGGFTRP